MRLWAERPRHFAKASADAKMHKSLKSWWHLCEYIVPKKHWNWQTNSEERRMNQGRRRTIPPSPLVLGLLSCERATRRRMVQSALRRRLGSRYSAMFSVLRQE